MTAEPEAKELATTDNYSIWKSVEPDGETIYMLQLGFVTLNFFTEEWEEFLHLMKGLE